MKEIVIDDVSIPIGEDTPEYFEAPDLEPAWEYYPNYLRYSNTPLSPSGYLMKILSVSKNTGAERRRLLTEFTNYIGNFLSTIEKYYELYKSKINQ